MCIHTHTHGTTHTNTDRHTDRQTDRKSPYKQLKLKWRLYSTETFKYYNLEEGKVAHWLRPIVLLKRPNL